MMNSRLGTRLMMKHHWMSSFSVTARAPVIIMNIVPGPMIEAKNCTA